MQYIYTNIFYYLFRVVLNMLAGIPIKYLSLIILVVQNSALILVMRYTRADVPQDKLYLASTAVVMSEVIKSIACLALLYYSPEPRRRSVKRLGSLLNRELVLNWRESVKLAFPAALYLIQVKYNNNTTLILNAKKLIYNLIRITCNMLQLRI